jgi:hypothetical protein
MNIAAEEFIPLVFEDSHSVLIILTENAENKANELSTEDMFELYRKIREIWDLYRQIAKK